MYIINARNVNDAYSQGLRLIAKVGEIEASRNGHVLVAPGPVVTEYLKPTERVLFSPMRDANPYFHFFESLWMLAGRSDVAFLKWFNSRIGDYSDDGEVFHGAYGFRWRYNFCKDQFSYIIEELRSDPQSRRCVLQMWSTELDLGVDSRDLPCNTHVYVDCRHSMLNITVCCRSNDIMWGAYGANAVHMSMLQEYLAAGIGLPAGLYRQLSNNYHLYTATMPDNLYLASDDARENDAYVHDNISPVPICSPDYNEFEPFNQDLGLFFNGSGELCERPFETLFFRQTVVPMHNSWRLRKAGVDDGWLSANAIYAPDWRKACCEWLERRRKPKAIEVENETDNTETTD
jgi:hypothetical protein